MRKLVNSTFVSLDGVINHLERWHFDFVDEQTDGFAQQQINEHGGLLMGRHTHDAYAEAWTGREGEMANRINAMPKYVASTTLRTSTWRNTTLLKGDLVEAVTALKQGAGQDILMHGYGPVAKTLMGHGLVDEMFLWVHPMLAGIGGPDDLLLREGLNIRLELLDVRRLASGVVIVSYRPDSAR